MPKVAIIRCETYDYDIVKAAVERGIGLVGGVGRFAVRGKKILLKPNLLSATPPEKCVTTHPSLFRAVAEVFITSGAEVSYGDSPAIGTTAGAAKKAGLQAVAEDLNIGLADFKTGVDIFFEGGRQNRKFVIAKGVLECDGVLSLPKLKTHGLEKFTGCVKNQFGCIPGVLKGEYHVKLPDAWDFGKMLVDLNRFVSPRLYIMDGIYGMEGNGPRNGRPRRMNMLLFSRDPIALDATVLRLIDLNPEYVPTTKFGSEFGAGTYNEKDIELVGDNFDDFKIPNFDIDRTPAVTRAEGGFTRFIGNRVVPKPIIVKEKCVTCGICVEMCPATPKAVNWFDGNKSKPPTYNYDTCIRCYCCQEVCPEGAIELKVPVIRKLLSSVIR
ncbi:MAG: DUF362 domain-containing protein [Thermodesulfobacteriota bacterium]|nr:DUF362 domain-containing protein [Thermodesulfobacteriota bacterium]